MSQSPHVDGDEGGAPPTKRGRRSQARRREILDTAAMVFYQRGYDASSTQDIADAVGILKGSLYYYVDSKEQFLFEIIKEAHDLGMRIVEEISEAEGDVLDRLSLLIHRHIEYFAANLVKVSVFFREFRALSPERQKDIDQLGHIYRERVEAIIKEGQAEGLIAPELDPALGGIMLVEMLNSISRWYHADGPASADEIAEHAAGILLGGIMTDKARKQLGRKHALASAPSRSAKPVATGSGARAARSGR